MARKINLNSKNAKRLADSMEVLNELREATPDQVWNELVKRGKVTLTGNTEEDKKTKFQYRIVLYNAFLSQKYPTLDKTKERPIKFFIKEEKNNVSTPPEVEVEKRDIEKPTM